MLVVSAECWENEASTPIYPSPASSHRRYIFRGAMLDDDYLSVASVPRNAFASRLMTQFLATVHCDAGAWAAANNLLGGGVRGSSHALSVVLVPASHR